MKSSTVSKMSFFVASLISGAAWTHAAVLLTIDVSNPSAVTITGTGALPSVNYSTAGFDNFPVNLLGFYSADPGVITIAPTSSTLVLQSGDTVNSLLGGRFAPGQTTLILRRNAGSPDQAAFDNSAAAFVGTAVFDLSSIAGFLPNVSSVGNIVGDDFTTVVGTYQVVPEPSTYGIVGASGCLALVVWRRARNRVPTVETGGA